MRRRLSATAIIVSTASLAAPIPTAAQLPSATDDIVVVDHGAEPRRALRYDWTVGHRERLVSDLTVTVAATEDGQPVMEVRLPVSMTINARVTEVEPNGSAWVAITFDEMVFGPLSTSGGDMPDGAATAAGFDEAMAQITPLLDDTRIWQLMDDRGRIIRTNVQFPTGFPAEAEQQIAQTSGSVALLPAEPVGVGARWESTGTTVNQGVAFTVTSTMELVALDREDVALAMTMRLADDAATDVPTLNPFDGSPRTGAARTSSTSAASTRERPTSACSCAWPGILPNDAGVVVPVVMDLDVNVAMEATDLD